MQAGTKGLMLNCVQIRRLYDNIVWVNVTIKILWVSENLNKVNITILWGSLDARKQGVNWIFVSFTVR